MAKCGHYCCANCARADARLGVTLLLAFDILLLLEQPCPITPCSSTSVASSQPTTSPGSNAVGLDFESPKANEPCFTICP